MLLLLSFYNTVLIYFTVLHINSGDVCRISELWLIIYIQQVLTFFGPHLFCSYCILLLILWLFEQHCWNSWFCSPFLYWSSYVAGICDFHNFVAFWLVKYKKHYQDWLWLQADMVAQYAPNNNLWKQSWWQLIWCKQLTSWYPGGAWFLSLNYFIFFRFATNQIAIICSHNSNI